MIFVFLTPPGSLGPPDAPGGSTWGLPGAFLEPCWAPRGPLGALLAPPETLPGAAPRALPGRFWRSHGALLEPFGAPGPHSRAFFLPEELFVLAFCATAPETATASWSLALETLDQLGISSGVLDLALGSSALSLALGLWLWCLGLGL